MSQGQGEFFLVVAPGLEEIARAELSFWFPGVSANVERGGITVHLPLREGLELNRKLKTVTRILLRLTSFGCRDFPRLYKKIVGFPWDDWVDDSVPLEFHATSHKSRLFVKKRIESVCADGRRDFVNKKGAPKVRGVPKSEDEPAIQIFVRLFDDVCTVSLDTSGELLHKRGYRVLSSEAPLRETIASALLLFLESAPASVVPHTPHSDPLTPAQVELVDPMMGAGTFLIEAIRLRASTAQRGFAFERCKPLMARAARQASLQPGDQPSTESSSEPSSIYRSFVGLDLDRKAIDSALGNFDLSKSTSVDQVPVQLIQSDVFTAAPLPEQPLRWLITNPPYGERIRVSGRLGDYYESLFEACERLARPERACFLLPQKVSPAKLRIPSSWRIDRTLKFNNGGLPVVAIVFHRTA